MFSRAWNRRRHRRVREKIDAYATRLASAQTVNTKEICSCHAAKLVIESGFEIRLRSLQTMAELGDCSALQPLIGEISRMSGEWPSEPSLAPNMIILMDTLKQLYTSYPRPD